MGVESIQKKQYFPKKFYNEPVQTGIPEMGQPKSGIPEMGQPIPERVHNPLLDT